MLMAREVRSIVEGWNVLDVGKNDIYAVSVNRITTIMSQQSCGRLRRYNNTSKNEMILQIKGPICP